MWGLSLEPQSMSVLAGLWSGTRNTMGRSIPNTESRSQNTEEKQFIGWIGFIGPMKYASLVPYGNFID
jgi:hypothetical protein